MCTFMRIIAGEYKSRLIQFPKTKLTRPITDRSRETVFNIVGSLVNGKHVLDLFSGSGSIGLEALSRGALSATFVEQSPTAVRVIEDNIKALGLESKARVASSDVLRAIDRFSKKGQQFSVVFVDPPYDKGLVIKTLEKLDDSGIVLPFGQVIVGHSSREPLPENLTNLKITRTKKIGQSRFSFYFRLESSHGETKSYISGEF